MPTTMPLISTKAGRMNYDVTAVRSPRLPRRNEIARPLAVTSTLLQSRDLTAVAVISAAGLLASLLFVLLFPDGLATILAQVP